MKKKYLWITVAVAAAVLIATAGLAFAADQTTGAAGSGLGLRLGHGGSGGSVLENVAKILKMDQDEVRTERRSGKSFADIAKEKGEDPEKLTEQVLEAKKAAIQEKVKDGTITQEQADACIERMTERVKTRVESDACGPFGNGKGQGNGQGRQQGQGNGACGGACLNNTTD